MKSANSSAKRLYIIKTNAASCHRRRRKLYEIYEMYKLSAEVLNVVPNGPVGGVGGAAEDREAQTGRLRKAEAERLIPKRKAASR